MRKSFITYIRPILEYNSIIWNPSHIHLIDLIENVQKKITKRIPSISNLSYLERLEKIRLDPLELRRLRFDLVNYYKILSLPQYSYLTSRFNIYHPPSSSRTCLPRLQLSLHATSKLSSSFFYRSIDVFNNLPVDIRTSASLDSFKSNLQKLDLSGFLKCSYLRN
jgi:hypothetical protein